MDLEKTFAIFAIVKVLFRFLLIPIMSVQYTKVICTYFYPSKTRQGGNDFLHARGPVLGPLVVLATSDTVGPNST